MQKGYCPLYSCPVWYPCQGGLLPHDGKAGGKNNQIYSVRQEKSTNTLWQKHKVTSSQRAFHIPVTWSSIRSTWSSHRGRGPTELFLIWFGFSSMCLSYCEVIWLEKENIIVPSWDLPLMELGGLKWLVNSHEFKETVLHVRWCSTCSAPQQNNYKHHVQLDLITCRFNSNKNRYCANQ